MMREHLIPQWPEILHKTLIKKTASNNEGMEEKCSYMMSQQVWNRLKAMFWSSEMFASEAGSDYEKMYFCA